MNALLTWISPAARTVAVLLLMSLALWPGAASAHAGLVSSSPSEGDVLAAAPTSVSFEFSEDMSSPAYVVVTAPDGSAAAIGTPVVDGATVTQQVRPDGADGAWTTAVRAVSQDGHPVTAQISFTVGAGSPEALAGAAAPAESAAVDTTRPRTSTAGSPTDAGWTRGRTDLVVALSVFALAGCVLLLSRRASR